MKFKLSDRIFDVSIDNKKILLDSKNGEYFELNDTASEIYNFLKDSPKTSTEIFELISKKYTGEEKTLKNDISKFLEKSNFIIKV